MSISASNGADTGSGTAIHAESFGGKALDGATGTGDGVRGSAGSGTGVFGGSGTFFWVDPEADLALACLTDLDFGPWALEAWPKLSDDVFMFL